MLAIIKTDPEIVARFLEGENVRIERIESPGRMYERRVLHVHTPPQSEYSFATLICHLDAPFEVGDTFRSVEIFVEPINVELTAEQLGKGDVLLVEPKGYDHIRGIYYAKEQKGNFVMKVVE